MTDAGWDDRLEGLWVCDDARGLRIDRAEGDVRHPLRLTATASDGGAYGVFPAALAPPLQPEDALPRSRMARVVAEVGEAPASFATYGVELYRWAKAHGFAYPYEDL